jgi:hypothetical protein
MFKTYKCKQSIGLFRNNGKDRDNQFPPPTCMDQEEDLEVLRGTCLLGSTTKKVLEVRYLRVEVFTSRDLVALTLLPLCITLDHIPSLALGAYKALEVGGVCEGNVISIPIRKQYQMQYSKPWH